MEREAILESKIEVLGKQVDDLKCCGNCKCLGMDDQNSLYCDNAKGKRRGCFASA